MRGTRSAAALHRLSCHLPWLKLQLLTPPLLLEELQLSTLLSFELELHVLLVLLPLLLLRSLLLRMVNVVMRELPWQRCTKDGHTHTRTRSRSRSRTRTRARARARARAPGAPAVTC